MKQVGVDIGSYTFDKVAKTIAFSGITISNIEQIKPIVDGDAGIVIFNPAKVGYFGSLVANVLTLEFDTNITEISNTDSLYISVNTGEVGQVIPKTSEYLYSDFTSILSDGGSLDSGWFNMSEFDKYQFEGRSGVSGVTLRITSSRVDGGGEADDITSNTQIPSTFHPFSVLCRGRWMRFEWVNDTGSAIPNCSMSIKAFRGASDKLSVFPLYTEPSDFSQAALVQSANIGYDINGKWKRVSVNPLGHTQQSRYVIDASAGFIKDTYKYSKFGGNLDIDIVDGTVDGWRNTGIYTGFNPTSGEAIGVTSTSSQDSGTLVSNGTATGGSALTLEDSAATFITDGVSVGDCIINDSGVFHGIITEVTSQTLLTVSLFRNGLTELVSLDFTSGDNYRIATTNGTGVAVTKIFRCIEEDYGSYISEYIINNGTTKVDTVGNNYIRNSKARAILTGSSNSAVGTLTGAQSTTSANIYWLINSGDSSTNVAADTNLSGKTIYLWVKGSMVRTNGSAGSARVRFLIRPLGESFQSEIDTDISNGLSYETLSEQVVEIPQYADFKWQVVSVSDNNTSFTGEMTGYIIDTLNIAT